MLLGEWWANEGGSVESLLSGRIWRAVCADSLARRPAGPLSLSRRRAYRVGIGGPSSETACLVTRVHYRVVLVTLLVNSISYIDRVFISVAAPRIRHDLNLSSIQLGFVFGAFSLAYFLFQTPWGSLADTYGARKIAAIGIAGWSLFTALCGAAWDLISMLAFRFGFGASEAAVSPAVASAYTRRVPVSERAKTGKTGK